MARLLCGHCAFVFAQLENKLEVTCSPTALWLMSVGIELDLLFHFRSPVELFAGRLLSCLEPRVSCK